jgi:hypothetical protein
LDPDVLHHKSLDGLELRNYKELFGVGTSGYMNDLGVEIQRSPLTHPPVRSYDPNRLFLMQHTGGGNLRGTIKGSSFINQQFNLSVDLLFQAFIVEVVRVPILMEWTSLKGDEDTNQALPGILDVDTFLCFPLQPSE